MATKKEVQRRARAGEVASYLRAQYVRMIIPNAEEGGYLAEVLELPGCVTDGETPEDAYHNLEEAMSGWIRASLDTNRPIPDPVGSREYSGHFPLRMSTELHRVAALRAMQEGVSLNQWIAGAITEKLARANLLDLLADRMTAGATGDALADKIAPKVVQRISVRAYQALEIQADIPASTTTSTAATTPSRMTKASRTTEGIVLAPEAAALTTERPPWRAVKAPVEVNQDA
jgi:antitoxin HicB